MSKVVDILFPMGANKTINDKLREKLNVLQSDGEQEEIACVLNRVEHPEEVATEKLKKLYEEELKRKDKLEDKAKTNIIGVTITITLIMGASGMLKTVAERFPLQILNWISFLIFLSAVIYMLYAGILAIKVLIDENVIYPVAVDLSETDEDSLRKEYDLCIGKNTIQNLIRNNSVFTSYECIRNALICLFLILILSTIPISTKAKPVNSETKGISQQYTFFFSTESLEYVIDKDIKLKVEQAVVKAIGKRTSDDLTEDIAIVDVDNNLFIKFEVTDDMINVILIESYVIP